MCKSCQEKHRVLRCSVEGADMEMDDPSCSSSQTIPPMVQAKGEGMLEKKIQIKNFLV
jgi:hypothetical protein